MLVLIHATKLIDAGVATSKAGSYIDTSKAIAFKQTDTYCAAPVASGKVPLVTYDFWATGVNCCSGEPGDFHCGEVQEIKVAKRGWRFEFEFEPPNLFEGSTKNDQNIYPNLSRPLAWAGPVAAWYVVFTLYILHILDIFGYIWI